MDESKSVATVYDIIVSAKRIKGEKNGKKYDFLSWNGFTTAGHKAKFKFTSDVEGLPKDEGEYLLKVDKRFINRDKKTRFEEYWVRAIISIEPYEPHFDENTEDLPF